MRLLYVLAALIVGLVGVDAILLGYLDLGAVLVALALAALLLLIPFLPE